MSFHAGNLGTRLADAEVLERNDLFQFGAKSRFALLLDNGDPYGNFFGMCHGKTAFTVVLAGFYFDDGESWAELLAPVLQALDSLR